jgi:pimeloyl-ACP methyl ester carboxylesterase
MKFLRWLLLVLAVLVILYLLGPSPATPAYSMTWPAIPSAPAALESYIHDQEASHKLKPDNEARIVWAHDSLKDQTEYVLLYLHGFSACQEEGDPVHRDIARTFGCNLYLARLAEHGIDTTDQLLNLTADKYWESAKQALAIARQLGKKVIVMGTSTGGTLALQLAAAYPDSISALVLLSPNIEINDPNAWVLDKHWGLQIARKVRGSDYITFPEDYGPLFRQYWYTNYRIEGAVALGELLETTMNKKTFQKVRQPTALLYYYKDKVHQDSTVKVSAALEMFDELGTPADLKYKEAVPEAGTHVIGSSIRSHDVESVRKGIAHFLSDILKVPAAEPARPGIASIPAAGKKPA